MRPIILLFAAVLLLGSCKKECECGRDDGGPGDDGTPPQIGFWSLPQQDSIVDAEYDDVHDRIIAVTANTDALVIIDPYTHSMTSVALDTDPRCVSVDPTGTTAVVGHDGWISVVDLAGPGLTAVHPISCDAADVVLADGWCYAFPNEDQWVSIHSMDLSTGAVTVGPQNISEKTRAKRQPGTGRLYGASGYGIPTDLETYDVSAGPATYLYDSPYHGTYPVGSDLWMSDTGDRIFTQDRSVFRTSADQADDMLYAGTVQGTAHIRSLDHHTAADRVCSISAWTDWELISNGGVQVDTAIAFHSGQFLDPLEAVVLPTALIGGSSFRFKGVHCFFSADGSKCHVLMKAWPTGAATHWAATTFPL